MTHHILPAGSKVSVHGRNVQAFILGSIRSMAAARGDNPEEAIAEEQVKAKKFFFEFQMAWLNEQAAVLDGTVKVPPSITIIPGDTIQVEGEPEVFTVTLEGCNTTSVRLVRS